MFRSPLRPSASLALPLCAVAAFVAVPAAASAQITFIDGTSLLQNTDHRSGVAMGVVDMNGDGRDDIVRLSDGRGLKVEYQGTPGGPFGTYSYGNVSGSRQWGLCIADANNDGRRDIFMGGAYDGTRVLFGTSGAPGFSAYSMPGPNLFVQGVNFADLDGDGLLDVFACHDDAESHKYRNAGGGTFSFDPGLIDTTTTPSSDNSGNYGSVFTDYDGDGDTDLYITKCRQGVTSPTDPRRINMLFRRDADGWTEVSQVAGMALGEQSWTADFGDLDGDGDMDAFIVNHFDPSVLMRNNGDGTFTDVTAASGLASEIDLFGIQSAFRDFDNDGNLDLLLSGTEHRLFLGDGALGFTRVAAPFPGSEIESFALGDLNSDGFVDVYAGYANLFNSPSSIPDRLFLNPGNSNSWLSVGLVGNLSNRDGVGARIDALSNGKWQAREVRSGESYGISNSTTKTFGLASAGVVDRLRVTWPSGVVDELTSVDVNQRLEIVEGSTGVRQLVTARMLNSIDDAEESDTGVVWRRNRDLDLVADGSRGDQIVGMRMPMDVPQGATIVDAWIQFTADERGFGTADLTVFAEATDAASPVRGTPFNLSLRQRTRASAKWSPPNWTVIGRSGPAERTSSLRSVVQELVDRPGWSPGNQAMFMVTGTGKRAAYSMESTASVVGSPGSAGAPILHVLYTNRYVASSAVIAAEDDAEERMSGYVVLGSPDLELVDDGANTGQLVAVRFRGVDVPPGATIKSASLQFTADEVDLTAAQLVIQADDSGAPAPLGRTSRNFSSRTRTSAAVNWSVLPWETTGMASFPQRTPDLSSVVQELVDRGDWTFHTDAVFLISGIGRRTAESFEGGAAISPRLSLEFTVPAGNRPPYVDAGTDQSLVGANHADLEGFVFDETRAVDVTWSKASGPGAVTFSDPSNRATGALFGTAGTYILRLAASDGAFTRSDTVQVTVSGVGTTVQRTLTSSSDDAEESDSGVVWRSNSDLELVFDGARGNQTVGLRFPGLNVPQGATITSATIQFTADESDVGAAQLALTIQDIGQAPALTSSAFSGRATTGTSVGWSPAPGSAGSRGPAQRTPDLAALLQGVVNRGDWTSGNACLFLITGTGQRVAASVDGLPQGAATLSVTYQ